jgi:hypothetical protein
MYSMRFYLCMLMHCVGFYESLSILHGFTYVCVLCKLKCISYLRKDM